MTIASRDLGDDKMKRILNPGKFRIGKYRRNIFIKVSAPAETGDYLSVSGVIGPRRSGNSYGGCGQIDMEFKHRNSIDNDYRHTNLIKPSDITFSGGWDTVKWYNLLDAWKKWHLKDMSTIPQNEIDFLFSLPETEVTPAWI